ncbi:hypothetical protein GUJ93_ZPchr0458g22818 [Zizania palustris]|uniref:Aspergillus nuclease S(1) n=1 Tax=Zizania palustris TaxID=103762 RepID=A0A8J5VE40_ZIZPA|nr:hypothetical protein GUJ93_ZPchr0458g22818 [Zizania palustris]
MGRRLLLLLLAMAAARAPTAQAWGKEGHYMVCKVAEGFLTSEAAAAVKELLPGWAGGDLAETCSWADTQRFRYRWSSPLHFADTPGDCQFNYARDCHNTEGEKDMCVVGAINNYTAALKDSSSPCKHHDLYFSSCVCSFIPFFLKNVLSSFFFSEHHVHEFHCRQSLTCATISDDPTESLMFLAHFVGDVHQPLHCGHAKDLGGNTIVVHWYTRKSNLHHVRRA